MRMHSGQDRPCGPIVHPSANLTNADPALHGGRTLVCFQDVPGQPEHFSDHSIHLGGLDVGCPARLLSCPIEADDLGEWPRRLRVAGDGFERADEVCGPGHVLGVHRPRHAALDRDPTVEVAEHLLHLLGQHLERCSVSIRSDLADGHGTFEQPAAGAASDEHEPIPLVVQDVPISDVGVGPEPLVQLGVGEVGGQRRLCDIEVADDRQMLRAGDEAGFRFPTLQAGVEHEQIALAQLQQSSLVGARIAIGEGLELGIEVHRLIGHLRSEPLWEVLHERPSVATGLIGVRPVIAAPAVGDRQVLERAVLEQRALDPT